MKKIFNGYPKILASEAFPKLQRLNTNLEKKHIEIYPYKGKRRIAQVL